ncbi:putative RDD family membrane protein YckC [Sinobacterium caligoides]|uniref:Putative RDD family membrane protein YckC n=1 Tax=Sinobacterium caligoides TaxID=933926 RepID=A0A3N2E0T4_9GAMM|nr:RDD family protein [Sinobacterium caligoides]ROS05249.1 putative RDD family membrane protein YckC [Sinobacterium caligoides]
MTTLNRPIAPLWRRLAAMFYDTFLLIGVLSLATFLYNWLALEISGQTLELSRHNGDIINQLPSPTEGPLYQLYLFCLIGAFYCYFWCKLGQTLGMQAWRLRVCQLDGQKLSFKQSLIRYLSAWLSISCFGLGYLWSLFHREGSSWHDLLSKSKVEVIEKRS